jgi:hypothetical protein
MKTYITIGAVLALVFGVITATPAQAHAFDLGQIIDPACFFACDSGGGKTTKTITNYYDGNYKSPGGTVIYTNGGSITTTTAAPTTATSPTYNNNNYNYQSTAPTAAPVYAYNYPTQYYGSNYTYGNTYNPPVYQQPVYQQPTYYPTYQYQQPIYVSCTSNASYGTVGQPIGWTAYVTGGSGYNTTYTWTGTDGMYGNGQSVYFTYNTPGYKTASVTVYSNGQSTTQNCSSSVSITGGYYAQPVYQQPVYQQPTPVYQQPVYQQPIYGSQGGLDVACYADPNATRVDQPVTWTAEATGGYAPYSYSWSGSGSLSGSAATVIKYYGSTGVKTATVTVTSADGRTSTRTCSNTVTIRGNGATVPVVQPPVQQPPVQQPVTTNGNALSAASLFSLSNIPWGWVSVLVILILFVTVLYLLFNKPKI